MRTSARLVLPVAVGLLLAIVGPARADHFYPRPVVTHYYAPAPVVSYYAPPVSYAPAYSSYYAAPRVSYYAAPAVSYYAAPAVSYYAAPAVSHYAAPAVAYPGSAVTTTHYGLFGRPKHTSTSYYPPVVVYP